MIRNIFKKGWDAICHREKDYIDEFLDYVHKESNISSESINGYLNLYIESKNFVIPSVYTTKLLECTLVSIDMREGVLVDPVERAKDFIRFVNEKDETK